MKTQTQAYNLLLLKMGCRRPVNFMDISSQVALIKKLLIGSYYLSDTGHRPNNTIYNCITCSN